MWRSGRLHQGAGILLGLPEDPGRTQNVRDFCDDCDGFGDRRNPSIEPPTVHTAL